MEQHLRSPRTASTVKRESSILLNLVVTLRFQLIEGAKSDDVRAAKLLPFPDFWCHENIDRWFLNISQHSAWMKLLWRNNLPSSLLLARDKISILVARRKAALTIDLMLLLFK